MRKASLKFSALLFTSSAILFILLAFLTLPKFLLLDMWFMSKGVYMTANHVQEGLTYLSLKGVNLYGKNSKVVSFDRLDISLRVPYLFLKGVCGDGYLAAKLYPFGRAHLQGKDFRCFEGFYVKSLDLSLNDGIRGTAQLLDIKVKDIKVDKLSLTFKGRSFDGEAKTLGYRLVGSGTVVVNKKDLLNSQLNATVSGGGMSLIIYGSLDNPTLEFKR